jgi:outer membrane protein assembly factor BamD
MNKLPLYLLIFLMTACSTTPKEEDETRDWTAEKFFQEAKESLKQGAYQEAIELFNKLEARFPFGRYAQQAQLETAYAYFKYDEPKAAITEADRFIKLNPRHDNVDYAYYLRGLASFTQSASELEQALGKDAADIDAGKARQSFDYFKEVVEKFPDSRYAEDSRQRMIYLRELLAQNELKAAQYYLDSAAYVAAANRAKYIIEHYQGTHALTQAMSVLVKSYQMLKMDELAKDAQRVYDLNTSKEKTGNADGKI